MKTANLLVEIGVEEIPASMLERAALQYGELLERGLVERRLGCASSHILFTPRRIIVEMMGIPIRQDDLVESLMGPPKSVAYDTGGVPTKAAHAFAGKAGIPVTALQLTATPKGEYLTAVRTLKGESTAELLKSLLPESMGRITFPKTMVWTPDRFRFARPIRWLLALYADRVVRFSVSDVTSSDFTSGHRFLGKAKIRVRPGANIKDTLRNNGVLADPQERRARIEMGLAREAHAMGGILVDDPDLMATVVNLNEYPSVVGGSFDPEFLKLPQEILITVMRAHQKYFSVRDTGGVLHPSFLAVINQDEDRGGEIRKGHERVLRARLADAAFFWNTDRKLGLEDRINSLKHVLFQEKLGSYYEKTERVAILVGRVAQNAGVSTQMDDLRTAARLMKCDLVTEMVKEFTDLQGIVGGLYAQAEGYPENVWRAIYEQYLPKAADSRSPQSAAGAFLALSDKLDSVCGCFSAGLIPKGSSDPFAVRRQANGIVKIILDHSLRVSLGQLLEWGLGQFKIDSLGTLPELYKFFEGRLRFLLEEMGFGYDCINAGLSVGFDDFVDSSARVRALHEMRSDPDLLALATNFKRIKNILAQAGTTESAEVDTARFEDEAEVKLWGKYCEIKPMVENARLRQDYPFALREMASMRPSVDHFFDKVLVMAEDPQIRSNRFALLNSIDALFRTVADISEMILDKN